jgi:nucleotide-binding universal stress UspA family protein
MDKLTSIIAATDLSDGSFYAAERAALLAKEHRATLSLLHVVSEHSLHDLRSIFGSPAEIERTVIEDARSKLRDAAAALASQAGVAPRTDITTGQVVMDIRTAAEAADVLVLGAHGANPLRDLFLGTTAERVLRTCRRPTLVVKRPPLGAYQHILVPVDFSSYSGSTLTLAKRIAPQAHITVVHAFRIPFEARLRIAGAAEETIKRYSDEQRQEAGRRIEELIVNCLPESGGTSSAIEQGDPSRVILAKEEALHADLIVIGKQGQSRAEELLLGSVTRHVMAGSKCDVLVVTEIPRST